MKQARASKQSKKREAEAGQGAGASRRKPRHVQLVSDAQKEDLKKQLGRHGKMDST